MIWIIYIYCFSGELILASDTWRRANWASLLATCTAITAFNRTAWLFAYGWIRTYGSISTVKKGGVLLPLKFHYINSYLIKLIIATTINAKFTPPKNDRVRLI